MVTGVLPLRIDRADILVLRRYTRSPRQEAQTIDNLVQPEVSGDRLDSADTNFHNVGGHFRRSGCGRNESSRGHRVPGKVADNSVAHKRGCSPTDDNLDFQPGIVSIIKRIVAGNRRPSGFVRSFPFLLHPRILPRNFY
jgi:hypothetical protein